MTDERAVKNMEAEFAKGRKIEVGEAIYLLTGVPPGEQRPQDYIGICAGLGIHTVHGKECPELISKEQYETLTANLDKVLTWNGRKS